MTFSAADMGGLERSGVLLVAIARTFDLLKYVRHHLVTRCRGSRLLCRLDLCLDWTRGLDLRHQVVVPGPVDLEMSRRAELDGLDHVVVDVGVNAGFEKFVERRPRGSTANEPGLKSGFRRIRELSG